MFKKFPKKTSEKRTTSLQGTSGPSPMCPLLGGFTVCLIILRLVFNTKFAIL